MSPVRDAIKSINTACPVQTGTPHHKTTAALIGTGRQERWMPRGQGGRGTLWLPPVWPRVTREAGQAALSPPQPVPLQEHVRRL